MMSEYQPEGVGPVTPYYVPPAPNYAPSVPTPQAPPPERNAFLEWLTIGKLIVIAMSFILVAIVLASVMVTPQ